VPGMRWKTRSLAAALILSLAGCGGGGSPATPSSPTPTPGPVRTLIAQGSQSDIPPASQGLVYFLLVQVTVNAVLEATVDWTSPSNPVALVWAQGDCTVDPNCAILVQNTTTAKPKTITTPNLPAGIYTLAILNRGTTNESVSYQIFLVH
jgi:hypothetical protein